MTVNERIYQRQRDRFYDRIRAARTLIDRIRAHGPINEDALDSIDRVLTGGDGYVSITLTGHITNGDLDLIQEWLRTHGINPSDVPVPSDITIDGGATVTVETHLRHPDGSLTGTKDDWGNLVDRTTTTTTVPLVEPWPLTREV